MVIIPVNNCGGQLGDGGSSIVAVGVEVGDIQMISTLLLKGVLIMLNIMVFQLEFCMVMTNS